MKSAATEPLRTPKKSAMRPVCASEHRMAVPNGRAAERRWALRKERADCNPSMGDNRHIVTRVHGECVCIDNDIAFAAM